MGTPMAHVSKSMMGRQVNSHLRSSPSFGFGTEERQKASSAKAGGLTSSPGPVYYPLSTTYNSYPKSPSHSFGAAHRYTKVTSADSSHRTARTGRGDTVPGPGMYYAPSAVSAQKDSSKHSYASWGFGTSTRADQSKIFISHAHAKTEVGFIDSPGPCAYRQDGSMGAQVSSRSHSTTGYRMGSSQRFFHDKGIADAGPAPGTYRTPRAVGNQINSQKPTYPTSSFTKADRNRTAKAVYMGPKQQSAFWGRNSPGPAANYSTPSTLGRQASSVRRSAPRAGFGTAGRFDYIDSALKSMNTPGPGSYSI